MRLGFRVREGGAGRPTLSPLTSANKVETLKLKEGESASKSSYLAS